MHSGKRVTSKLALSCHDSNNTIIVNIIAIAIKIVFKSFKAYDCCNILFQ